MENKLSRTEEALMVKLWELKKAYLRDLLDAYDEPKPATTTLATLLKRMREKGYVDYTEHGKHREYYPLVKKSQYFSGQLKGMIRHFFNNSPTQFASFFTESTDLTEAELQELKKMIDEQLKSKK
ncbi:BlaI/MecI/CopY family transcriptional regulator [Robertkochia solimangrovi]|uniref:BlaI/MecI/CopY family transcriptional regulator n=1 Tax=Robertkochia solimangrovi TaxID=2213046 RepID=UPI00117EAA98|nr:BlaI/MecI/CopY family transcriptional regulator [Robertkochia solimangrovi]TRZ41190.1 BlaI/MecI/CopY family transcriptional regulator [Robertkochia solimangrovi]